jgi:hypothetical protein
MAFQKYATFPRFRRRAGLQRTFLILMITKVFENSRGRSHNVVVVDVC